MMSYRGQTDMKNNLIKIGIIGCGWIVEHAHIPSFRMLEGVTVSSLFDIDIQRASRLAKFYNVYGVYDDLNEFFNSGIDAVIVATPNILHVQYSLQALEHGLNVLCEKPVAFYSDEVKQLMSTAKRKNRLFVPGFVNRFRCDIMKIREIVQSNKIGDILSIEAGWLRRSGIPRPGTWFTKKSHSGGGVLIDLGSHVIDICLMLFGDKAPLNVTLKTSRRDKSVRELNAHWFIGDYVEEFQLDVEDTAFARVEFDNNAFLSLTLSWAADIEGDCTYFIIHGSKGNIKLKTLFGFSDDRLWKEDSLVLDKSKSKVVDISFDKNSNNTKKAFHNMASFFVDVLNGKNTGHLTDEDALKTVSLIEKLYSSEKKIDSETEGTKRRE